MGVHQDQPNISGPMPTEAIQVDSLSSGFVVGINGGHEHSSARTYCIETHALSEVFYGEPLNFHPIDHYLTQDRLIDLLAKVADGLEVDSDELSKRIAKTVIAFPGAGSSDDQRDARQCIASVLPEDRSTVIDDTWAGLFAEVQKPWGICAFSGAGASVSVALGSFTADKRFKIDGWGPLIGDFGSSFQLAVSFFRNLGRCVDRQEHSLLFEQIQEFCGCPLNKLPAISGVGGVQAWFDSFTKHFESEWRVHFSKLAIPITRAADATLGKSQVPDEAIMESRRLVRQLALDMATSINIAIDRLPADAPVLPVVLQGGTFRNSRYFQKRVVKLVSSNRVNIKIATRFPVDGAMLLAADDVGCLQHALQSLLNEEAASQRRKT